MSKPQSTTPTLRDIAEATGLALSTVSSALRGLPGVAPKTVERVRKAAEDMGWRPNPLVSAWLSHVRSTHAPTQQATLGFLVSCPEGLDRYFSSSVYEAYLDGARARAAQLGFSLEVFHYEAFGGKRLGQILEARGIPGIVVAPLSDDSGEMTLNWDSYAVSTISYSEDNPQMHRVSNHHFHSAYRAVEKLTEYGYRRIGLAIPQAIDERSTGMFSGGFWSATHALGNEIIQPFHNFPKGEAFEVFGEWLDHGKPDAVIGLVELIPDWIESYGHKIPEDIAFVNLDWRPGHEDFAGIDQDAKRIGMTAVDLVTSQLFRNERGLSDHPKLSLVESNWRDGPSAPRL